MDISMFIVTVYCVINEWLAQQPRQWQRSLAPLAFGQLLSAE